MEVRVGDHAAPRARGGAILMAGVNRHETRRAPREGRPPMTPEWGGAR